MALKTLKSKIKNYVINKVNISKGRAPARESLTSILKKQIKITYSHAPIYLEKPLLFLSKFIWASPKTEIPLCQSWLWFPTWMNSLVSQDDWLDWQRYRLAKDPALPAPKNLSSDWNVPWLRHSLAADSENVRKWEFDSNWIESRYYESHHSITDGDRKESGWGRLKLLCYLVCLVSAVHFETSEIDPYSSKKRPPNKHHSSNRRAQGARLVSSLAQFSINRVF